MKYYNRYGDEIASEGIGNIFGDSEEPRRERLWEYGDEPNGLLDAFFDKLWYLELHLARPMKRMAMLAYREKTGLRW